MTYDLRNEEWIPAQPVGAAQTRLVGLQTLLTQAHEFAPIRDPLPTVEFGLYRLLIALLLDIFFLEPGIRLSRRRLSELREKGVLDAATVTNYFDKYADRFDLFSPTNPFLQTAGMGGEEKPLAGLLHPQPSGTNAEFFAHGHEDDFGVCPAAAARLLTTLAPWMTAGGAGLSPSVNGAPPIYALVMGETVWETLWLNLFVGAPSGAKEGGRPAWHGTGNVGGARKTSVTYVEALTWMPRRIRLLPGAGGRCALTGIESPILVRAMHFGPGAACDFSWRDPNCAYRLTDKGPLVLRLREGRALWRDTGPLALLNGQNTFERPAIVAQDVGQDGPLQGKPLRLTLYGLRTDMKMKVFEWQRESLTLPAGLADGTAFTADALKAIGQAEKTSKFLSGAIRAAWRRKRRKGEEKEKILNFLEKTAGEASLKNLCAFTERNYWIEVRPEFETFLKRLAPIDFNDGPARDIMRRKWADAVKDIAECSLNAAIDGFDADNTALERQARAFNLLNRGLSIIFR